MAVRNRIRDVIRKHSRHPANVELSESLKDEGTSPLERVIGAENVARYDAALERLDPAERQANRRPDRDAVQLRGADDRARKTHSRRRANGGDSSDEAARSRDARVITDDAVDGCHRRHHRRDTGRLGTASERSPIGRGPEMAERPSRTFRYREGASDLHRRIRRAFIRGAGRSRRLRPCRPARNDLGKIPARRQDRRGELRQTCIGRGIPSWSSIEPSRSSTRTSPTRVSEIGS